MRTFSRSLAVVLALMTLVMAGCSGTKKADPTPAEPPKQEAPKNVELQVYYPVAVGGDVAKTLEGFMADFTAKNPTIKVTPVYAGNYQDTMTKVQTSIQGQTPPDVAILQATDVFTLTDMKALVPLDDYLAKDADGKAWLADFQPAFMGNSVLDGKTYGIPFQRSTVVLYYNKELFKSANLDPEKPPETWDQLVEYAKKLTKPGSVWGVAIPSDGLPSWTFSSFFIEQGQHVVDPTGTKVDINNANVASALQFIQDLSKVHKVMAPGVVAWGPMPADFAAGKVAMIYHTTGSIASILKTMDPAKFGVAPLPAGKKRGAPTGGGNLYIFKTTPEKQQAAYQFIKFMTEPERVAKWSAATGYVPARLSATQTQPWKDAVAKFAGYQSAADALKYSEREIASHDNQKFLKAIGDQLQAVVTGEKSIKDALVQAQKDGDAVLKQYQK